MAPPCAPGGRIPPWTTRRRERWRRGLRSILPRLLVGLVPAAVLLLGFEGAVRLLWEPPTAPPETKPGVLMGPHPTRLWGLVPGFQDPSFTVDARGLRAISETGAPLRALTLGDSSIFGHGLPDGETLHASLAAELSDHGVAVDVFCGGVPGYSTEQSRRLMEEMGWSLEPDLLVLGNLWSDHKHEARTDRERMARRDVQVGPIVGLDWLRWLRAGRPLVEEVAWDQLEPTGSDRLHRVPLSDYARNVDQIFVDAAKRSVAVAVLAPVNRSRFRGGEQAPTTWNIYFATLQRLAARRGVPLVDARAALIAAGLTEDAAFIDDLHPSGASNAAYARALAAELRAAGWPDGARPDGDPPLFDEVLEDPGLWAP